MDWIETNKQLAADGRPLRLLQVQGYIFVQEISETVRMGSPPEILAKFQGERAYQEALVFLDNWDGDEYYLEDPDEISQAFAAKRYDTNATCFEISGPGADGAYNLVMRDVPPEAFCAELLATLKAQWGLGHGKRCRLTIHIGPAGSGDNLPI